MTLPAADRARTSEDHQYTSWDRARLSVVVPIGVIVAVAIVCIVVAVLSSAQRADEVAVEHETQLISTALSNFGARALREVESVATSQAAIDNIRVTFEPEWVKQRVGNWLETFYQHDFVFVFDGQDKPVYAMAGPHADEDTWFRSARPELTSVLA
jgi:sensor domain CHASE-containing protein